MVSQQDILDLAEAGIPFRPARARGLARGLRVVEGEPSALARARALRSRVLSPEEYQRLLGDLGPPLKGVHEDLDQLARTRAEALRGPLPELTLDVLGPEGQVERTFRRRSTPDVRFSPEATASRDEAMRRHFEALTGQETEDPRAWFAERGIPVDERGLPDVGQGPPDLQSRGAPEAEVERWVAKFQADNPRFDAERFRAAVRGGDVTLRGKTRPYSPRSRAKRPFKTPKLEGETGPETYGERHIPPDFLDRFENQHGWRPRTLDEALAMLTDDQIRELSSPSFWGPEE